MNKRVKHPLVKSAEGFTTVVNFNGPTFKQKKGARAIHPHPALQVVNNYYVLVTTIATVIISYGPSHAR
jgi:hypothetical protein